MELFVHHEEFKKMNVGFALDEGKSFMEMNSLDEELFL